MTLAIIVFAFALLAWAVVYLPDLVSRFIADERGNLDLAGVALKERVCDATNRIPTSRWPLFSTTKTATFAALAPAGQQVTIEFEAERDTLFTDLSIRVYDSVTGLAVASSVGLLYCNTTELDEVDTGEFGICCARKPFFLVGVRENKKLRMTITLAVAAVNITVVEVSLTGLQGDGCCS